MVSKFLLVLQKETKHEFILSMKKKIVTKIVLK